MKIKKLIKARKELKKILPGDLEGLEHSDRLKFLNDNFGVIQKIFGLIKIFTGKKGDAIINMIEKVLKAVIGYE